MSNDSNDPSEIGEVFSAHRQVRKEKKLDNLAKSKQLLIDHGIEFQEFNNGIHLKINYYGFMVDFWPSTGKYKLGSTEGRGVMNLLAFLSSLVTKPDDTRVVGNAETPSPGRQDRNEVVHGGRQTDEPTANQPSAGSVGDDSPCSDEDLPWSLDIGRPCQKQQDVHENTASAVVKIERGTAEWDRRALVVAKSYIQLKQCRDCGSPCVNGYCCTFCNSIDP